MARRLAAIMFTDVVGFTASAQANEATTLSRLREQEGILRPLFGPYGGKEIKSTGDGFLVEFESALKATECAVEIQRRLRERNARDPKHPIQVRIGVHVGDVEEVGGDIFGDTVNVASRVVPLAEPGGVCLSAQVFDHVRNKIPYPLEKLSPKPLKGVRDLFDVYHVVLPWNDQGPPRGGPSLPRLAVLPFANISPDPKDEYFADGLTEELISVLSQVRGLRVIARTSVSQYKGTTKPIAQIGSELGVGSVLEGSVRKADSQLRITVQLIDVGTEEHRWAQTYDRKLDNVFAIQAEVAEQTAGALKVELLKSERDALQERPTSSMAAYELYLRGNQASRQSQIFGEPESDRLAVRLLEGAIREDPQFSAAYSSLANHLLGALAVTFPARDVVPRVRELVAKALELSPTSSEAHTARGNLAFQGELNWTLAEAELQQAIALNPSSSVARFWYGYLLGMLERFNESNKQYLAAIELDPLWILPRFNLIANHSNTDRLESAIAMCEKLIGNLEDDSSVHTLLAYGHALAGRADAALQHLELAHIAERADRRPRAMVLGLLGHPEEARALLREWEEQRSSEYVPLTTIATYSVLCGDDEKAITLLEKDCREGDRSFWSVYQLFALDPIRDDPRFVAMLRSLKLPTTLCRTFRWTRPH